MPLTLPCDACSFRRVKCDGKNPCSTCLRREQSCTYLKVRKRRGPKGPRRSTNARVQAMQKNLGIEKSCSMRECSLPASDDNATPPEADHTPQPSTQRISLSTYYTYIDIFRSQLYTVWPIVSTNSLKAQLNDVENIEFYALAAALCAATLAQLRLPGHIRAQEPFLVTSSDFVRECLWFRAQYEYQNNASLESLRTSLFLHMYYANVDQIPLATFALRDAITHAHLLNLGNRQLLKGLQPEDRQLRLRVYWILLVTERTFCMQHDLPITLQTIDDLPVPVDDGDSDPALLTGFCSLVRLFTRIDGPLLQAPCLSSSHQTYSRARIAGIQEALQTGATKDASIDEVQRVDIWITLAWLSSLLWQYSASHFMLTPQSSNTSFAPSYPFIIARNFLSLVCGASLDSVRPHGYGMEIKLFQLANSLIDILVYVPSQFTTYDSSDWGPRHAVVALDHLLDLVAGGKSERLDKLRTRMAQMNFTPTPMRALQANEGDESPRGFEGLSVVDEIPTAHEADDTFNYHRTGAEWSEEDTKVKFLEIAKPEVDFSGLWPDLGFGVVSFFSGDGTEMQGHGEDPYIYPADIFGAESRICHSVGVRPVYSKFNRVATLVDDGQASEYLY
ncbi:hypothetical protein BDV12DRAFT_206933 [Aspergillus spectabilis]